MSDTESKTGSEGRAEEINGRLDEAKKALDEARAESRARIAAEKRDAAARNAEDAAQREEELQKKLEDEKAQAALREKKLAELEYAESVRKRMLEERAAANKIRIETVESDALLPTATDSEAFAEAERRNAEADELLSAVAKRSETESAPVEEEKVEAEEPSAEAEEPSVEAEEPSAEAEEPSAEAEEPSAEAEGKDIPTEATEIDVSTDEETESGDTSVKTADFCGENAQDFDTGAEQSANPGADDGTETEKPVDEDMTIRITPRAVSPDMTVSLPGSVIIPPSAPLENGVENAQNLDTGEGVSDTDDGAEQITPSAAYENDGDRLAAEEYEQHLEKEHVAAGSDDSKYLLSDGEPIDVSEGELIPGALTDGELHITPTAEAEAQPTGTEIPKGDDYGVYTGESYDAHISELELAEDEKLRRANALIGAELAVEGDYARDNRDRDTVEDYEKHVKKKKAKKKYEPVTSFSDQDDPEGAIESEQHAELLGTKELKKRLDGSAKDAARLRRAIEKKKRKAAKKHGMPHIILYKEAMELMKELLQLAIEDYKLCLSVGKKKYIKRTAKQLDSLTDEYNSDLEVWRTLTGSSANALPYTLSSDVANGIELPDIPEPTFSEAEIARTEKSKKKPDKKDIDDMHDEQLALIREEVREKRREKRERERESKEYRGNTTPPITDKHMARDLAAVEAMIDFRLDTQKTQITAQRLRFGPETKAEKREREEALRDVKVMKSAKKALIKATRADNARYMQAASGDAESQARAGADIERMREIAERIRLLLIERDEINEQLLAYYRESDGNVDHRKKVNGVRFRAAKRSYRAQKRDFRRISSYRIPLKYKTKLYALMNKRIELMASLAELKYRAKIEKSSKAAKKSISRNMKDVRRRLKQNDRDLHALNTRTAARAKRARDPKSQLKWLAILLLTVAACIVGYFLLKDKLPSILGSLTGGWARTL